jgi:uncharacterized surface protein with fasciclin (FAS1) repeats
VSTRRRTLGLAAAIAAITVAVPTAVQASAEPTPEPAPPAADAATPVPATPAPTTTKVPNPEGPGCDAYRNAVPTGPGSIEAMATQIGSQAIASNPDLSTFSAAISGKLNPDINIVDVLDGGPYVVFAPTDAAFAKMDPAQVEVLKTDPVVLLPVLFYHMVLGFLGPGDVAGTMPTQDGRTVEVTGEGGDIKVNGNRVTCAYSARGAYIYMIDEVLTPPAAEAGAAEATATPTFPETSASATPESGAPQTSETSETPETPEAPEGTETPEATPTRQAA